MVIADSKWILVNQIPNLCSNDIVESLKLPSFDHVGLYVILNLKLNDILNSFVL